MNKPEESESQESGPCNPVSVLHGEHNGQCLDDGSYAQKHAENSHSSNWKISGQVVLSEVDDNGNTISHDDRDSKNVDNRSKEVENINSGQIGRGSSESFSIMEVNDVSNIVGDHKEPNNNSNDLSFKSFPSGSVLLRSRERNSQVVPEINNENDQNNLEVFVSDEESEIVDRIRIRLSKESCGLEEAVKRKEKQHDVAVVRDVELPFIVGDSENESESSVDHEEDPEDEIDENEEVHLFVLVDQERSAIVLVLNDLHPAKASRRSTEHKITNTGPWRTEFLARARLCVLRQITFDFLHFQFICVYVT